MTPIDLDTLREGWDFEAKLAAGQDGRGALPESLWETYSAMANTKGGLILLGAKERKDGSLEPRGFVDVERVEADLWNLLQNPQKVSANVLRREDVERVEIDGCTLLLLRVPKAARGDRPVYMNGSWERGAFVRVHEGDRRADREVARRMLADAIRDRDSGGVDDLTLADLNADSVRRYREFFAARRPEHPFLQHNDEGFLVSIGAARRERGGAQQVRPTWAGLWMLGEETTIRELAPHWHLSYRELPEDPDDGRRWLDRIHPDGLWNANLFEFYRRVIVKLQDGLKVPFEVVDGQFRVDETPIHLAVREALVNALVHADYQGTTGIRVLKRRGVELINPGLLLITPEQVWRGGVSEPRNPALQRLFSFLRLGEREGSGGPTMRRVWHEQHWRAPRIWEDVEHNETHLQLPLESLLPNRAVQALIDRWGPRFTGQDELGRVILVTAEVEGSLNHPRARELSEAHSRDITLKLQELVRNGLLKSSGNKRGTTYTAGPQEELPLFAGHGASSPHNGASSPHNGASSPHNGASSPHDEAQRAIVDRVRVSGRTPPQLVRSAILVLCEREFVTVSEMARSLNRKAITIQQNYVSQMLAEGLLDARYPETPNHPAQAYRTRRQDEGADP
ncbi:putative DNA binding domain-containing protein [Myxococcota bacterium]|nr:putative DNA binding domain-containing protein [Myxococcota bacterium]